MKPQEKASAIPDLVMRKKPPISSVWLLPILAITIGSWLWIKSLRERGPQITIAFETAKDIEAGSTVVRYKNVEVGTVEDVEISADLSHVVLHVELTSDVQDHLGVETRFWVVRPHIGVGGISGLSTLISGPYIEIEPGPGPSTTAFTGLENPPVRPSDAPGLKVVLHSRDMGSVSVGSPVTYHKIPVGEVEARHFLPDQQLIAIDLYIEESYAALVRERSRFWNASGIDVALDTGGLRISTGSLESVLTGGIAFDTPGASQDSPQAVNGAVYSLYSDSDHALDFATHGIEYQMNFRDSVRGLSVGASVEFRGVEVGCVTDVSIAFDADRLDLTTPVRVRIDAAQLIGTTEGDQVSQELLDALVRQRGLRARLESGNIVTGSLYIGLDLYPNAPLNLLEEPGDVPEIPTIPTAIEALWDMIDNLALDELVFEARDVLAKFEGLLDKPELADSVVRFNRTLTEAEKLLVLLEADAEPLLADWRLAAQSASNTLDLAGKTLRSLDAAAGNDSEFRTLLESTLSELGSSARSIRFLAEYLERHPEALLYGKDD